jgi:hypothetical protein
LPCCAGPPAAWLADSCSAACVALHFILFHKQLCGPLANSLFHHQPATALRPNSKLETAFHKADHSIQNIIQLLEAA